MKQKVVRMSWINWLVHTVTCVIEMDCRVLSQHAGHCWIQCGLPLIQTGSKASHVHRRQLLLHELATKLLHGHASARFRTPKFLEVTKRRHIQKCIRRSGIITAATGMSSSLGDVTATLRIDVDDATCALERKSGRRENATHVECRFASSTAAVWWRRVWHAPRLETNARVISQWAGAECDYCRGREDCSDALTWNTIISVRQIKSIFAPIAVFSFYNIYISQYSRQRSFLWYKNTYVTCNTGCYIDVLIWVIFDPHA